MLLSRVFANMFSVSFEERTEGQAVMRYAGTPFYEWLWEEVRKRLGSEVTQGDIALGMRVPPSVLSAWLKGKSLPARKSEYRLATYFGLPLTDIHHLIVESECQAGEQGPIMARALRAPISAGGGAPSEVTAIPYWPRPEERSHDFVSVEVVGDCLEPYIRAGQWVVVDTTASPRPGDVVAAEREGEQIVKVLEKRNNDLWLVAAQGQAPIKVDEQIRLLGSVVWAGFRPVIRLPGW